MDDSILNNMSDEDLLKLIKSAGKEVVPSTETAPVKFKLGDGTEIQAKDNEELSQKLGARLEEAYRKKDAPVETPQTPQAPPKWDQDVFATRFLKDASDGMEYLETAKYGMPVGKMVPQLLPVIAALAQKVQAMEMESFTSAVPDYKTPEARQAIDSIIQERGWQTSRQSLQDAYDIAKGRGMVQSKETKKAEVLPFIPPRVHRSGVEDRMEATGDELVNAAQNMPIEKLEELLFQSGVIKTRRA